jgi:class 3 adenylate cyclase/tetratricopeptide (TPR) repeat protein
LSEAVAAPEFASPDAYTPKHIAHRILSSRSTLDGERKQITVLFADIKGSLEIIEGSDPEQAHLLLDTSLSAMMDAVHRYDGTVNKVMGDGIMALFGAPLALEDHAVRACYAALAMQDAARRVAEEMRAKYGVEPQIRVGLNSGEVVVRAIGNDLSMDYDAIGPTTHLAGRMEQLAIPGTIRLTQNTLRLAEGFVRVRSLGPVPVKGLECPIEIFELVGAMSTRTRFQASITRGLTRFVGRDIEMVALERAVARAEQGHGQVFALVGEAGVGKSRLYYEFVHSHRAEGKLVLESRSVSYGKATAYFPVIDLLKTYFDIEDRDDGRRMREKVTGKLLTLDEGLRSALPALLALLDVPNDDPNWDRLEASQRRRRTLDALRALFLRESQVQPLIIIFEDLHWIDGESQAFLDSLVESLPAAPTLLLVNYRPEYAHGWGSRSYYAQLRIEPLAPESTTELLDSLLGGDPDLAQVKQMLITRTEGNPFFVEESVRELVETGALDGSPGAYRLTRDVASIDVPATVQGVLVTRIDRLSAGDKHILQAASVVGKDVPYAILEDIIELPEDALRGGLADLQESEFLYESRIFPDLEYTFKHAHTHDVTYGSLLAERRRALHQRIADAIGRLYPERLAEQVERQAHHAFRGEMWERAVDLLRQSGAKAAARSAYREAAASLEQALEALRHLPDTDETRTQGIDLRFDLRGWLQPIGEHAQAVEHLREAEAIASVLGDQKRIGWASAYLSQYLWWMGDPDKAELLGQRALSIASASEIFELEAIANFFMGQGHYMVGNYRRAVDHCRRTVAALEGERAYQRLGATGLPSVLSRVWLAWALAEQGEFAGAAEHAKEGLSIAEAAEQQYSIGVASLGVGQMELLRGDIARAISALERAIELSRTWGMNVFFPLTAGALGLAYALGGRIEEALPLLEEGEANASAVFDAHEASTVASALGTGYLIAGKIDAALEVASRAAEMASKGGFRGNQARISQLLGEIYARQDPPDTSKAEDQFRRSLAMASELGMRPLVAHSHLGIGQLYERVGRRQEAEEHVATALTMYRDMDMRFWLEQVNAKVRSLG